MSGALSHITACACARWSEKCVRARAPASNDVRELVTANINVLAIDEYAVANVTLAAPSRSVRLVGSYNHMAVSSDANDIVPITG